MKNNALNELFTFCEKCNETLLSVFNMRQLGLMENYSRSCWLRIIQESRFAKIPAHIASQLDGIPHAEVCTMLIMRTGHETRVLVADRMGVNEKRLDTLTYEQLERVRQTLNCNMMAASVIPSERDNVHREYLIQYVEKTPHADNFYIA